MPLLVRRREAPASGVVVPSLGDHAKLEQKVDRLTSKVRELEKRGCCGKGCCED